MILRMSIPEYVLLVIFVVIYLFPNTTSAFFFDWFWTQTQNQHVFKDNSGPFLSVPFEYKTDDEKFLEEASKFTDLMKTSSLDVCQHKVILQIKTSCFSMTEEELAKMSVNLLNCQSQVDGRKVFQCSESMNLKECTKNMDANMWNAYHLMNNRARAVCLATRRTQFQALSEMTVNKLMATAHDQIMKMTTLLEGQQKLEILTQDTLQSVQRGNAELIQQQNTLKDAQKKVQDFVEFNLQQLSTEKALIAAGNKELADMTEAIKEKLDKTAQQLNIQSAETAENHINVLKDIEVLQLQAHGIFKRIDSSTEKLLAQHEMAAQSYKSAMENLIKINNTVHYLLTMINKTRDEIDVGFYWIQEFLNGTGEHIGNILSTTFHIIYLLVGMLFASFLNFSNTSRVLLATIVPLNLFVTYNSGPEKALDFLQISVILTSVICIASIRRICEFFSSSHLNSSNECICKQTRRETQIPYKQANEYLKPKRVHCGFTKRLSKLLEFIFGRVRNRSTKSPSTTHENCISSSTYNDRNENSSTWNDFSTLRDNGTQQSLHTRVNDWLQAKVNLPRASSPSSTTSGSPKFCCSAVCRSGRRCKNTAYVGRDVCHKHLTGS